MDPYGLFLWQGEVCTDDNADPNADTNDNNDARWTKHDCISVIFDGFCSTLKAIVFYGK